MAHIVAENQHHNLIVIPVVSEETVFAEAFEAVQNYNLTSVWVYSTLQLAPWHAYGVSRKKKKK